MNEIDEIIVTGGRPLHGSVRIQGSKNAALPVMAAALLSTGTSVLRGCPRISDVYLMEKILKYLDLLYRKCIKKATVISDSSFFYALMLM